MSERRVDTLTYVPVDHDPFADDPVLQTAPTVGGYGVGSPTTAAAAPLSRALYGSVPTMGEPMVRPTDLPRRGFVTPSHDPRERVDPEANWPGVVETIGGPELLGATISAGNIIPELRRGNYGAAGSEAAAAAAGGAYFALGGMMPGTVPLGAVGRAVTRAGRAIAPYAVPALAGAAAFYPGEAEGAPLNKLKNVFHGSPHDFERFDIGKIGTGEGAQAYGHGLYFAESPGVAQSYRDMLGGQRKIKIGDTEDFATNVVDQHWEDMAKQPLPSNRDYTLGESSAAQSGFMASHYDLADHGQFLTRKLDPTNDWDAGYQAGKRMLQDKGAVRGGAGRMYEAELDIEPEHLLDWDKPLKEQSGHVQGALAMIPAFRRASYADKARTGADVVSILEQESDPAKTMQQLRDAGIKGTRFLDQESRGYKLLPPEGDRKDWLITHENRGVVTGKPTKEEAEKWLADKQTSNYVVFDDKTIEIVKKYGLAAVIGGGAAAGAGSEAEARVDPAHQAAVKAALAAVEKQTGRGPPLSGPEKAIYEKLAKQALAEGKPPPELYGPDKPLFPESPYVGKDPFWVPPGVVLKNLQRAPAPRGIPDYVRKLADPANVAEMNTLVEQGRPLTKDRWYDFQPWRQMYHNYLGPQEGEKEYLRFLDMAGSTTHLSKPEQNYATAAYYAGRARRGEGLPSGITMEDLVPGSVPSKEISEGRGGQLFSGTVDPKTGELKPLIVPPGYGGPGQQQHRIEAGKRMRGVDWDPMQNPKPPSFIQNMLGNYDPYTWDTRGARQLHYETAGGKPSDAPEPHHYGYVEGEIAQEQARRMNIPTSVWQQAHWAAGDPGKAALSGLDIIEQRIRYTAMARRQSPKQVMDDFFERGIPYLSIGGGGIMLVPVEGNPFPGEAGQ